MLALLRVGVAQPGGCIGWAQCTRAAGAIAGLPCTDNVPEPSPFWEKKMFKRFEKMDFNKVCYLGSLLLQLAVPLACVQV